MVQECHHCVKSCPVSTMGFTSVCCGYQDSTFGEDSRVSELSNQAVMVMVSIVMMVMSKLCVILVAR